MKYRYILFVVVLSASVALSSCGGTSSSTTSSQQDATLPDVDGPRMAIAYIIPLTAPIQQTVRPGSLLSIYANILLADGLAVPVHAAMDGVDAQVKLHAPPTAANVDDLYALLDEYGAVLHVDVPDLLNRSDDRAHTLDEYLTGLQNITERAKRRAADVQEQVANLKTQESQEKTTLNAVNKDLAKAVKANDFATAQQKQSDLTDAQTAVTKTDLQLKEMTNIANIFKSFNDISDKRLAALQQNREVLIAGLTVTDVPGVEDLGVLDSSKRKSTFNPFGGL